MARGRKPKPAATEPAPTGVGHNLTKTEFIKHADRIAELDAKLAAVRQDLKTAYDDAEKAGIDKKALKAARKVLRMVSHERREHFGTLASYLRWMNVPVGAQFGLFENEVDDDEAEESAPAAGDEGYMFHAGYQAGREGRKRDDAPKSPKKSREDWQRGYDRAQADLAEEMSPKHSGKMAAAEQGAAI